jgi:hypothetical protein
VSEFDDPQVLETPSTREVIMRLGLLAAAMLLVSCGNVSTYEVGFRDDAVEGSYPMGPNAGLTPGAFCAEDETLREYRYAENIRVCKRDVNGGSFVLDAYDIKLGYRTRLVGRDKFKVDHFIPLCMGGSNKHTNLWPQHLSISEKTDAIEEKLCLALQNALMTHEDAVASIRRVKTDLSLAKSMEIGLDQTLSEGGVHVKSWEEWHKK